MSNDLNLGDLGITINLSEGEPASAQFTLPDGSVVTRPFTDGELSMRLGLGLGLGYQTAVGGGASAPSNTGLPVISGTAKSGQTLSATNGTWNDGGAAITGYAYQWKADGVAISGATSSTFLLTNTQIGAAITVTVTATNTAGSTAATSAGTEPVATGAATDPHFANVVLLCGFEGVDGSTSFVDEGSAARALTAVGNAQIDTAQAKFGASSLLLDGNGDRVTAVDSDDFTFPAEFTIEAWARLDPSALGAYSIVSHTNNLAASTEGWSLRLAYAGTTSKRPEFTWMGSGGTAGDKVTLAPANSNIDLSGFHHFCVDRDAGGIMRLYLDGVMVASRTGTGAGINAATLLRIGAETSSTTPQREWKGWIDDLRITKGVARYASDAGFTVPAAAFPRS